MRITEVRLPVAEVEKLRFFYAGRLGLPLVARRDDAFCVEAGSTRLWFQLGEAVSSHFALNVPPNRFADAKAWAAERVPLIEFEGADELDFSAWEARAAYFLDPAGNVVELIARDRLPDADREGFDAGSIAELSEIGLPVTDVGQAVGALEEELGLPHFDGNRRNFSAVGDDRGLFIVVPVGRSWFPTEQQAGEAGIDVEVAGEVRRDLELPGSRHRIAARPSEDLALQSG